MLIKAQDTGSYGQHGAHLANFPLIIFIENDEGTEAVCIESYS
jgi:hypothetical protein